MGRKLKDITGQKFHKLTALYYAYTKHKTAYWNCACDCGRIITVAKTNLGANKTCGCEQVKKNQNHLNWKGRGDLSASFVCKIKNVAKRRNIQFDLTIDYLWNLFELQTGKCALSGLELTLPFDHNAISHGDRTASLDRINSNIGYIEGNVQWVHKDVNMMKQQFDVKYFIELCNYVSEYNNG